MAYDYIFCGFGLSTMLVLDELLAQGLLEDKSLLILEMDTVHQEQTWCFWEKGAGKWDNLLSGHWHKGFFEDCSKRLEILGGLTYKSISAETLRQYIVRKLGNCSCTFKNERVLNWIDKGKGVSVYTKHQTYSAGLFFNSAFNSNSDTLKSKLLLQHFEGWYIESAMLPFAAGEATIMDFTVPQKANTRFMYVLPFSETEALVEYTMFSPGLIPSEEYGEEIKNYLLRKGVTEFTVKKKETGVIPMTIHPFWEGNTSNILHIGTTGGWTKPSTGYTFANAAKMAQKVAAFLRRDPVDFQNFHKEDRFRGYDRLLIEVLYNENEMGEKLFGALFAKTDPGQVMRFLNEETNLIEDLQIISACPKKPFLAALCRILLKK